jgi:hypothetical protein
MVSRIIPTSARNAAFLRVMVGVWTLPLGSASSGQVGAKTAASHHEAALAAFGAGSFAAPFATGLVFFAAALRTAAHRLRVASTIAFRPAALSLRFGLTG